MDDAEVFDDARLLKGYHHAQRTFATRAEDDDASAPSTQDDDVLAAVAAPPPLPAQPARAAAAPSAPAPRAARTGAAEPFVTTPVAPPAALHAAPRAAAAAAPQREVRQPTSPRSAPLGESATVHGAWPDRSAEGREWEQQQWEQHQQRDHWEQRQWEQRRRDEDERRRYDETLGWSQYYRQRHSPSHWRGDAAPRFEASRASGSPPQSFRRAYAHGEAAPYGEPRPPSYVQPYPQPYAERMPLGSGPSPSHGWALRGSPRGSPHGTSHSHRGYDGVAHALPSSSPPLAPPAAAAAHPELLGGRHPSAFPTAPADVAAAAKAAARDMAARDGVPESEADLANVLMAWYYAGFYTGKYKEKKDAAAEAEG